MYVTCCQTIYVYPKKKKREIAELYLDTKSTQIIQYCDLYECFPLLCKLYSENPDLNLTDFFENPFSVYEAEIDTLRKTRSNEKYCALALCTMFNNRLKEKWFTEEINTERRTMLENTCEACRLNKCTPRLRLLDELKTLGHSFIKKEKGVYKTLHDKLFDFLFFYFGKHIIHCLIKNGDVAVITQRFLLKRKDDMDQFITIVPPKYHQIYIQSMVNDWRQGRIQPVFTNINMEIPEFRQRFLCHSNTFDISFQRQLALTSDLCYNDTVLLHCCHLGDIPWIKDVCSPTF